MSKDKIKSFSSRRFLRLLVLAALLAFISKIFVAEAYRIPTSSMENTLFAGDYVIVNKLFYGPRTPEYLPFTSIEIPSVAFPMSSSIERNEILVFEYPNILKGDLIDDKANYIKRCVALPGDTLTIINRQLFVNGKDLKNPLTIKFSRNKSKLFGVPNQSIFPNDSDWNEDNYGPILIPKEGQAVKLSSRNHQRWFDIIRYENPGAEISIINNDLFFNSEKLSEYEFKNNYYFFLGDNRDESFDSRYWGFVPEEMIIGKPLLVYWSIDQSEGSIKQKSFWEAIRWERIGTKVN